MINNSRIFKAALCLVAILFAAQLLAYNTGDYRSKWSGSWEDQGLWQIYNGSNWVDAHAYPGPVINADVYASGYFSMNGNHQLNGRIIGNNLNLAIYGSLLVSGKITGTSSFHVMGSMEIDTGGVVEIGSMLLDMGGASAHPSVINKGQILTVNAHPSLQINGSCTFVNSGLIQSSSSNFNVGVNSDALLISTESGSIRGMGNFSCNWSANFEIANPQGLDGALALSGSKNFERANFKFNGTSDQVTGVLMPAVVLGIIFDNPHSITLSQSVNVINEALLTTGTTLEMERNVIGKPYWGAGVFTMEEGSTLITAHPQGISSSGDVGAIQVSIRKYHSAANYGFNADEAQLGGAFVTAPEVDPDRRVVVNSLHVDNPSGVIFTYPLLINGDVTVNNGFAKGDIEISGEESRVDGINSSYYYHCFEANGIHISNYRPQTDTNNHLPDNIHRRWNISGSFAGIKRITFYWNAADDADIDWTEAMPVVKKGGDLLTSNEYDISSDPRWITVQIPNLNDRASFTIVKGNDDTLPVELSAYNLMLVSGNTVRVNWVSQSETNLIGYRILRSSTDKLENAETISPIITAINSSQPSYYFYEDKELSISGTYYYWLESMDLDGTNMYFGPMKITVQLGEPGNAPQIPTRNGISKLFPNPFSTDLNIAYEMASKSELQITIYNQRGQLVRELFSGTKDAGRYSLHWDGRNLYGQECPSGIYFINLKHPGGHSVEKAMIIK